MVKYNKSYFSLFYSYLNEYFLIVFVISQNITEYFLYTTKHKQSTIYTTKSKAEQNINFLTKITKLALIKHYQIP